MVKRLSLAIFGFLGMTLFANHAQAQNGGKRNASWLIPGIRYSFSDKLSILAQAGWNPQQDISYIFGQGQFKVNRYVTLTAGYMFISLPMLNNLDHDQSTLLYGITLSLPIDQFAIEGRTLIWNRFIKNSPQSHLNRNRLRVVAKTSVRRRPLQVFLLEEVTIELRSGDRVRNRTGAGLNIGMLKWLDLELDMVRQNDVRSGKLDLFFISFTYQLGFKTDN